MLVFRIYKKPTQLNAKNNQIEKQVKIIQAFPRRENNNSQQIYENIMYLTSNQKMKTKTTIKFNLINWQEYGIIRTIIIY